MRSSADQRVLYAGGMSPLDLLAPAIAELQLRIDLVGPSQLSDPTPCEGWNVVQLLEHCVGGARMSTTLLGGGTREHASACFTGDILSDSPASDFATAAAAEFAAYGNASLEAMVPHPAMDMPVSQVLSFRITDYVLHAWDLARAIGADETLNPELVAAVWTGLQPMVPMIAHIGVFGTGPSGTLDESTALQLRLLDLTGRRP